MAYQTATHHTLQKQESNGISAYTDKRQVSDGISDSYPPHTTKRVNKSDSYLTQIKRQDSDGISGQLPTTHYKTRDYPPHTTKQESNGISDSYLTQTSKDKSVMAYQTATHHTLQNKESNGKSDSYLTQIKRQDIDGDIRQLPTTHYKTRDYPPHTTKKESNGKSYSYLTQIKRQVSDGISDSYPPHTTKQESNSYLTQIKRQVSHGISDSYTTHYKQEMATNTDQRQVSDGISDSYPPTHYNSKSYLTHIKRQ
ncbi:unnamed protein product [Mytilus edulis]|uniref:Uncharacterized protein n=1 Tax=Mytilus edulis TaxID=6550 RepID=A0A8S3S227_MYTED|nr:unnamed protein product [Mytilus edulis]